MKTSGALTTNLLEPNFSSTLAEFQRQVTEAGGDLSLLKMTFCGDSTQSAIGSHLNRKFSSSTSSSLGSTIASLGAYEGSHFNHQQHIYHLENITDAQVKLPLTKMIHDHVLGPMQSFDHKLDYYFSEIWLNSGDERTSKFPLMTAGPWKLIYATIVYLYLIKWLLPKVMQNFPALELNWCIRGYNLLMVLSNMYAFYHGARILSWGIKCFGCEVIDHRDYSPQSMELLHYGWLFFLSRLVEWLDTIFFVLRKKGRQVTKLHVFHHSFVPILCWIYLKYHPGYTVAFFPFVNTLVHTIMYTYYLLATFGPRVQPYLWWKKYLTSLQIVQFVLILIQLATIPLSTNEKCQYPRGFLYVAFTGAILFLWLFYTYYIDTYKSQKFSLRSPSSKRNSNSVSSSTKGEHRSRLSPLQANRENENLRRQFKEGSSHSFSDFIDNAIGSAEQTLTLERRDRSKSD